MGGHPPGEKLTGDSLPIVGGRRRIQEPAKTLLRGGGEKEGSAERQTIQITVLRKGPCMSSNGKRTRTGPLNSNASLKKTGKKKGQNEAREGYRQTGTSGGGTTTTKVFYNSGIFDY